MYTNGYVGNYMSGFGNFMPTYGSAYDNYNCNYNQGNYNNQQVPTNNQNSNQTNGSSNPQVKLLALPVGSIEEAKAIQTPFDGTVLYLINSSKGEIYCKSLSNNGEVLFNTFSKSEIVSEETEMSQLKKRLDSLEKQLSTTPTKKGKASNDEQ